MKWKIALAAVVALFGVGITEPGSVSLFPSGLWAAESTNDLGTLPADGSGMATAPTSTHNGSTAPSKKVNNPASLQRIDRLSTLSGKSSDEIAAMREKGMGWGEIAQQLGIHPGELGLGKKEEKKGGAETRALSRSEILNQAKRGPHGDSLRSEPRRQDRSRNHPEASLSALPEEVTSGAVSSPSGKGRGGVSSNRGGKGGKNK